MDDINSPVSRPVNAMGRSWHEDSAVGEDYRGAFWCSGCGHYHAREHKSWHPVRVPAGGHYCTWCIQAENG